MTLQQDMDSKLSWTQEEIDSLKRKYSRTHFDHFPALPMRLKRRKVGDRRRVNGTLYVWGLKGWETA